MCVEPSLRCKYSIDGRAFQRGLRSSVSVVYTYLRVTTANLTVTVCGFSAHAVRHHSVQGAAKKMPQQSQIPKRANFLLGGLAG